MSVPGRCPGLTLKDLATAAGMSQACPSRVENHKVSLTTQPRAFSEALDVPMAIVLDQDSRNVPITHTPNAQGERRRLRGRNGLLIQMLPAATNSKLMESLIIDWRTASQPTPLKAPSARATTCPSRSAPPPDRDWRVSTVSLPSIHLHSQLKITVDRPSGRRGWVG